MLQGSAGHHRPHSARTTGRCDPQAPHNQLSPGFSTTPHNLMIKLKLFNPSPKMLRGPALAAHLLLPPQPPSTPATEKQLPTCFVSGLFLSAQTPILSAPCPFSGLISTCPSRLSPRIRLPDKRSMIRGPIRHLSSLPPRCLSSAPGRVPHGAHPVSLGEWGPCV